MSELEQLLEMGFPKPLAEEALKCTGNNGLDAAMDWLVEHQGDTEPPASNPNDNGKESDPAPVKAMSYKCDDCNKSLRTDEEVELHSARTGHVNFSESADEMKALTEEEKKAQMEKLQELLRQKKTEREAIEVQNELEREKRRRQQGKDIVSAKQKFQDDEIRRMVEERRREKLEDKAYREKLVAQIAREREEKKLRDRGIDPEEVAPPKPDPAPPVQAPRTDYTKCRILIRFSIGQPLKAEFGADEPLSAVILHISQNWPGATVDPSSIDVFTTFPKREFSSEERQSPLSALGLCPSAVLNVRLNRNPPI